MRKLAEILELLFVLLCLSGCAGITETKTIVLPTERAETAEASSDVTLEEEFLVKKIYTTGFEGAFADENAVFFQEDQEHGIWYLENTAEGSVKVSMDYRYGFFEKDEQLLPKLWRENIGYTDENIQISPDGSYMVFSKMTEDYSEQLWLRNTETGEEKLLQDAAAEGYPSDQVYYVYAFSQDGKTLCYGCVPLFPDGWEAYGKKLLLHCIDLEAGGRLLGNVSFYHKGWSTQFEEGEMLDGMRLFVDRFEDRVLTVLVKKSSYYNREEAMIYTMYSSGMEEELWAKPTSVSSGSFLVRKASPISLDAENGCVYPCIQTEWKPQSKLEIAPYYFLDTPEEKNADAESTHRNQRIVNTENEVLELLVLNEGKAIITAEQLQETTDVDIYLYQWNGEEMVKKVLYKNAGYVYSLRYDSKYHRLLAVTDDEYNWLFQALILEFAR